MKRIISTLLCAVFLLAFPLAAYASGSDGDGVSITVVIPNTTREAPAPAPSPRPANYLFPVSVWENHDGGRREIIRTYHLNAGENPRDISRESFTREGWLYELADITRNETASADAREHTETVSIDTATNDMAAILRLLDPTMEFQSDDEYIGVLTLDISSIKVETAGTRTSSFDVSATREYPHLATNDTSLIPKTITDNGRTLTLSGIDWRVQNYTTIDYIRVPDTYTAVATYTGTGSRTTVTGYITTAEYNGQISKLITGRTVYTAYFIGVPIVTATVNRPGAAPETAAEADETPTEEPPCESATETTPAETEQPTETETPVVNEPPDEITAPEETEREQQPMNPLALIMLALLAGLGIGGGVMFFYNNKFKKKKEVIPIEENEDDEEILD
jgi:hypothetical protein